MNQIFSFDRWMLLMRRHWLENGKLFLYGILSLIVAMCIALIIWLLSNRTYVQSDLVTLYMFGLYIIGAIFASGSFDMLQKKEKAIYYLSLPASHFEKLLTLIVYNTLFFTLVYSLCFYGLQWVATLIAKAQVHHDPVLYKFIPLDLTHPEGLILHTEKYFMVIFFGVQALFVLGSVYFKRFSFLLTIIFSVIFLFFATYYVLYLRLSLFPHFYWDGAGRLIENNQSDKAYKIPEILNVTLKWICLAGWAPVLWWCAYLRLREKEI